MNRLVLVACLAACIALVPSALADSPEPEPGVDCKPGWTSIGTVHDPLTGEQVYDIRAPTGEFECY